MVAEASQRALAASSRFCQKFLQYPDPRTCPDEFCHWIEVVAGRCAGAVFLPMTDLTVPLVLRMRNELKGIRTVLPSSGAYQAVTDKYRLFELASAAGVKAPRTTIVSRLNFSDLQAKGWSYPVVVKPRQSVMRLKSGVQKRSVRYAMSWNDVLQIAKETLLDDTDELLVQEYIRGRGAGVFALYEKGNARFFFAHQRLRETPPSGGVSVLCESVPLPEEGVTAIRSILDPLQWNGVAMMEFKIDDTGHLWLIEVNARFWGSLQLAVDCNADFPWYAYQIAVGISPSVESQYVVGEQLRWWLGDLGNLYTRLRSPYWTPTIAHKIRALAEFSIPWRPRMHYEFFRLNDPRPSFAALGEYFRDLTSRRGRTRDRK